MSEQKYYVPILQWRRGEQKALEFLDQSIKDRILPLIEIVPIPWDYENDTPSKTLDKHLENIGDILQKSLVPIDTLFLDLNLLDKDEKLKNGQHPLTYIIDEARRKSLKVIPVTGFNRDSNYQNEVKKAYLADKLGVCIRITDDDLLDINSNIDSLLNKLSINPSDIYVIIDLKYIAPDEEKRNILTSINIINSLPYLNEWKMLILCATAFPENTSSIQADSIEYISRTEWNIWEYIYNNKNKLKRMPLYGDYVISNPEYFEMDPRLMRMTANIRYTSNNDFIVLKGKNIREYGWEQASKLCKKLINMQEYCGQTFSWGDKYIYDCAQEVKSTGNAEIWRRVGTNHHLTFVVNQLSTLSYF